MNQDFQSITGFLPRQFQQQTISKILDSYARRRHRNDVLLRAPTGAGKTETAIAPFLIAKNYQLDFPHKLIYVVPLRTLANSLRQRAEQMINNWSKKYPSSRPLVVTLQTGENPEDPRFEGDIIFCTIDQMLSSFLNIPYSVGRGSANINAGAIFASYLVFDELHLLDPDRSFVTVLKILTQVKGIAPYLLMTATLTDEVASQINTKVNTEIIRVNQADLVKIERDRSRKFRAIAHPLTAKIVLDDIQQNQRKRVIIICNTVSQAQGIFQDLKNLNADNQLKITLLHSRFLPADRAEKELYLKETFAQNWQDDGTCQILIATQVIEAGLNITCEVMHTHLSPMNSLLQRAGRCARFAGEQGEVFIYQSFEVSQNLKELTMIDMDNQEGENVSKKSQNFLPYDQDICDRTWQVLERHTHSELVDGTVDFRTEEQWINQVHGEEDLSQAKRRENDETAFNTKFNNALFQGDRSTADDLIRSVDNRSIFIWSEDTVIDFDQKQIDPKKLLAFSVPLTILLKVWRESQKLEHQTDWIFQRIEYPSKRNAETYNQPICKPINNRNDLIYSIQILVNPRYIHYDHEIGLVMGVNVIGNSFISPEKTKKKIASEYRYQMDNYVGHLVLMWKSWREPCLTNILKNGKINQIQYSSVRDELLLAAGRFIQAKIFPEATIRETQILFEYLVLLAIFTHDLGKLQIKWQEVMRGWQKIAHTDFNGKNPGQHLLAHTDYNPEDEQQKIALKNYEKQHKRPNHAIESAYLSREILSQSLLPILRDRFTTDRDQINYICHAVLMAIGRHHSAWAKGWETDISKVKPLQLHPDAQKAIASSWRNLIRFFPTDWTLPAPPNLSKNSYEIKPFDLNRFNQDQTNYLQLYWLIVRALRLCDQRSVQ